MSDDREKGTMPDKDTPPWLQAVPEDEEPEGFFTGRRKLIISAGAAVTVIVLFGAVMWTLYEHTESGPARHITAPQTTYKEKPADPGGMDVPYQDKKVFEQADGEPVRSAVKLGAQPEQPVDHLPTESTETATDTQAAASMPAASQPEPKPAPRKAEVTEAPKTVTPPAQKAEAKPAVPASKAYQVQLGAYGSEKGAASAWRVIRGKYRSILGDDVKASYEPVQSGDRTLYRLRVGPLANRAAADAICLGLRARQQACIVVNP
ncbi:SPOR domain-containing protein [Kordiimonas marina]|uniref:SPOR domain-containing protein n=1 Tax=Kordiimonas marina TaxID=2872312 RepID=UPI001FF3F397|nr:SPOR domain-containing protein [Kordiimonas marina]MCJ9430250.1 SPOR domain-containing protein [Kordiimonas marina]